jgi:phosphatidate cytidylyltransferase
MFSDQVKSKFKNNGLIKRTITAAVFVPFILFMVYLGGFSYILMNIVFMLIGLYELIKMTKQTKPKWRIWFFGAAFIIVTFCASMIFIREISFNLTLFTFLTVWITDTSAYFCGIVIGGRKLAPKISPGKTLSGFLGALAFAGIFGLICHLLSFVKIHESLILNVLSTIFISLCSQVGDLAESAMKRKFEVKDSGTILPGHGGLLDRFDGLSFASIAMVLLISL